MVKHLIGGDLIDDDHPLAVAFNTPAEHLIDGDVINEDSPLAAQVTVVTSAEGILAALGITSIPTEDPGVAGEIWNDSGVLKASAG